MTLEMFYDESFYLLRVLLALALGFAIGLERKLRYKEAGMRTHAIVTGGSALMMIVSKYGFADIGQTDGARIAAQIVTGIGFLGAGIIIYKKEALRGLTTAAGIWSAAGIGMAAGAGMYWLSIGAAVLIILFQCLMHLKIRLFETKRFYFLRVRFTCGGDENETLKTLFHVERFSKISFTPDAENLNAVAEIRTDKFFDDRGLLGIIREYPFIKSVERIED